MADRLSPQQLFLFNTPSLTAESIQFIAGVDEVGRGALFGPVVAAAVILDPSTADNLQNAGVTDSKKLSAPQREAMAALILRQAIACCIGLASVQEIDRLNILNASLLAMQRAIQRLTPQPQLCLIDGNRKISGFPIPQQTIVKGDLHCLPIAAASIVAKVWRDRLIVRLAAKYPQYDLASNKGYGTVKHRQALQQWGASRQHRRSFSPCKGQLQQQDLRTDHEKNSG